MVVRSHLGGLSLTRILRSVCQPLQAWECKRASRETELALDLVEAEVPIVPFPLSHTKRGQTAREMMPLRPFCAGLTAGQLPPVLADPNDFLNVRADRVQAAHLQGCQRQTLGGVVLLAVADHQDFQASRQPAALRSGWGTPMLTHRVPVAPAVLLQAAYDIPAIVANPLAAVRSYRNAVR
jgi:hypothetical protein